MSALVPDRSTDPAVIKLAADISAEQGPEIETMKAFLVQWKGGAGDRRITTATTGWRECRCPAWSMAAQ